MTIVSDVEKKYISDSTIEAIDKQKKDNLLAKTKDNNEKIKNVRLRIQALYYSENALRKELRTLLDENREIAKRIG